METAPGVSIRPAEHLGWKLPPQFRHLRLAPCDVRVNLVFVIIIIGPRGINIGQRQIKFVGDLIPR